MATPGRKLKEGPRTPSGQLSRALQSSKTTALVSRARPDVLRALGHPEMGTVVGRFFLLKEMTARQYSAALKLAALSIQYDRAICAPPRSPLAQDVDRIAKTTGVRDGDGAQWDASRVQAMDSVKSTVGPSAWRALETVVICDRLPDDYAQRLLVFKSCDQLADFWRIPAGY